MDSSEHRSRQKCTLTEIPSEIDFDHHTSSLPSATLLIIYFHAPWAPPCQQMSTILSTLASTYTAKATPTIAFLSVNAEELPEISEQYDVTAVPYIVLQKGNKTVDTISGSDPVKVRTTIEKHAGPSDGNPGKLGLPPAQQVTRKAQKPTPVSENDHSSGAKDLSTYAPTSKDPSTAPAYSSAGAETDKEPLEKRLSALVKAAPVMLFMKGTPSAPQCGFSRQTVSLLREKGVRYGFFNILADDEVRQGLKEYADWPTFPQVWVGGELVGGLDLVKDEFEDNPDFLKDYSVSSQRNAGGPAAPAAQAQPA